jgi:hypothetical protein
MPRTVTTIVYQYDELSDKAKAKARDEWRRIEAQSGDNSWAESTEECFKEAAAHMGWNITNVAWSGFSSQGDGAQFEGDWSAERVNEAALKQEWPAGEGFPTNETLRCLVERFAALAASDTGPKGSATVRQVGRYSHSNATEFEVTDTDHLTLVTFSRQLMDLFYRMLEQEYDYRNSDEVVAEAITSNESEFTEDGKLA